MKHAPIIAAITITLIGITCLTIGAAILHPAAGWFTAGTCLTALGLVTDFDRNGTTRQ